MARFGPDTGEIQRGPVRTKDKLGGTTYEGLSRQWNPRAYCDLFFDFNESEGYYDLYVPLFDNTTNLGANEIPVGNGLIARGTVEIPRAGRLISAHLTAEDALATNDTNYVTFAVTNKLGSGSGAIAMLAATDGNTTKATGGVAIDAIIGRVLTVHGTAANLAVVAGDVLVVSSTTTQTLANIVDQPIVRLRFATIPPALTPFAVRTAGSPICGPVDDTANGEIICSLNAANEAETIGFHFGDQLVVPATKGFLFEVLVKVGTVTTAQQVIMGMASAYNDVWDDVSRNAWFKLAASLALVAETDDGTADHDDTDLTTTLTAGTYYLLRIDGTDKAAIEFYVNDALVGTLAAAALAVSDLLQPIFAIQKASGTGVVAITMDYLRLVWARW